MRRWHLPVVAVASLLATAAVAQTAGTLGRSFTRGGAPSVAPTTSVRSLYVVHCAGCHGIDGAGSAVGGVPDMRRLGLFLQLDGGREFIVKVPGVMGAGLSDAQIADVSNWVLANIAPGSAPAPFRPYDAGEIARARRAPLIDVAAARAKLIELARARGIDLR